MFSRSDHEDPSHHLLTIAQKCEMSLKIERGTTHIDDNMHYSDLIDHPEGGRFQEIYRSATIIQTASNQSKAALTHIYFSLNSDEVSRFHRVLSDEVWNLYQGTGLVLYQWDGQWNGRSPRVEAIELSERCMNFCHVVPAGHWQAAAPLETRILVGCSVAPGFEYADFEIMDPKSTLAQQLRTGAPHFDRLITPPIENEHSAG